MAPDPRRNRKRGDISFINTLWAEFSELFPTDEVCMLEILRKMEISTTHCKLCGGTHVELQEENRMMVCYQCKKIIWLTAGTFFGYIKRPRAWLGAIWLIEHGAITNACAFQKLAEIAYSSSLGIFHKINTAVAKNMSDEFPTFTWSAFCDVYARRTRETHARQHPSADERSESDDMSDWEDPLSSVSPRQSRPANSAGAATSKSPELNELQKSILKNLTGTPIDVDKLCDKTGAAAGDVISNLSLLELMNLVRSVGVASFVAAKSQPYGSLSSNTNGNNDLPDTKASASLDHFMHFINWIFDRIGQKYLRQYLASYWCLIDRVRWKVDAVFDACKRFGPLPYKKLVYSRSPREVFFPTAA